MSFAFASSITPGPNNVLLAASGLTFGFRRTLPLVLGIEVGFLLLLLAVAVGLGAIFERLPWLQLALRVVGVTYLLYLAWSLWRSSATGGATLDRPLGFAWGAMFQLVNPKAWMMAITMATAFHGSTGPDAADLAVTRVMLGVCGVVLEQVVEDGVADLVSNLVRVTFGHGLGRKNIGGCHVVFTNLDSLIN